MVLQKSRKTFLEKEKFVVRSNFSFSNNVFRRVVLQTNRYTGFIGKVLTQLSSVEVTLRKKGFERENSGYQTCLLFSQAFECQNNEFNIGTRTKHCLSLANAFDADMSKF